MKKLLHIVATPRGKDSRTLEVSGEFLDVFKEKHGDWVVEELDLSKETLPSLSVKRVDGKYVVLSGKELSGELKESWEEIVAHIEKFLSADAYLISTPMWNFSIPYMLKHYIDIIIQPKYLFRYTTTGVEGLVKGKKMLVVASRGGDYSAEPMHSADFQEPYLRAIFGLVGIKDIDFIVAQPMDMGPALSGPNLLKAQALARQAAARF
ncbi:MAG: NAD(P)H-dependent oxidoreductase [Candidatus Omnitrophica bacterium]|nr:NAD(P)H-dependent oxidoreductase [Candidatus Omnitrophota bacterium]